jgi:hypothetical protein
VAGTLTGLSRCRFPCRQRPTNGHPRSTSGRVGWFNQTYGARSSRCSAVRVRGIPVRYRKLAHRRQRSPLRSHSLKSRPQSTQRSGRPGSGGRWRPRGCRPAALMPAFHDPNATVTIRDVGQPSSNRALCRRAYARFQSITLGGSPPCASAHARISLTSAVRHASNASLLRGAVRATTSNPIVAMLDGQRWANHDGRSGRFHD